MLPSRTGRGLQEVFFGYLANHPVLRGMSLVAQPGEHIVLVGRTGAGKSSVLGDFRKITYLFRRLVPG